jgi:hypothetical protein
MIERDSKVHRARRLALAAGLALACGPSSDDDTTAADTGAATTSGSLGAMGGSLDTTGSGAEDTGTTAGQGTTGTPPNLSCDEAFDQATCAVAGGEGDECGWFPVSTWALDLGGQCVPFEMDSAYCFLTARGDDGCGLLAEPSCPDGLTVVYYNTVGLEIGAVELFVDAGKYLTCDGPGGPFMPCVYDGETWDPPECVCGCL